MTKVEAYNILGDLWYEATSKEKEAINIAQDAVQFVDLMPKYMVAVVRCKDCVHWYDREGVCLKFYSDGAVSPYAWQDSKPDDFCSYGERRKDGDG